MRAVITFKVGEEAGVTHTRHYDLEAQTSEMLKADFLAYLNGGASALRGASYRYTDVDTQQPKELLVRFDQILHIELMPIPTPHDTGLLSSTANTVTGPLSARLGGPGSTEGAR